MKTLLGAVAGALTVGAVLVSYNLGERQTFSRNQADAVAGAPQIANPFLVQASQGGQTAMPFGTSFAAQSPYGGIVPAAYAVPQYASQRVVTAEPVARRAPAQRTAGRSLSERQAKPARTWQKSALLIGGSAAGGAGVGALIGGKKGAGIGALLGGGTAAVYDQVKRH